MVKIISRFFISLTILLLMIVGAVFILISSKLFSIQIIESYVKGNMQLFYLATGTAFCVISFLSIYTAISSAKQEKVVTISGDLGDVEISLYALEDYIKRICIKESFVKAVSVKILLKRKNIITKIKASIWSGYNIPEIVSKIQTNIRAFLENDLNLGEESDIRVCISKIIPLNGKEKVKSIVLKEEEEKERAIL
ncbi:MAG: alkaline shock response membrane anchor protein AmaP [bacterium]|nr:alkaline shock response membrane anchor protein AmaP [bacterium]